MLSKRGSRQQAFSNTEEEILGSLSHELNEGHTAPYKNIEFQINWC